MKVDEVAKNLLEGNSCRNCAVSNETQFMNIYNANFVMRKKRCKAKLVSDETTRLRWIAPKEGLCVKWEEWEGYR